MDDDAIVGVWCDEGPLEGNRRLDDDEEAWDVCDDNDDAACSDGNDDDEYDNDVLVQPVVVAVLPIGSTGATKGSQDGNDGDDGARGGATAAAVCGAVDVAEALDIATLDAVAVERGKDGDDDCGGGGCWYFDDALGSLAGSDGNGPLPVS